jgi:hypothetical protein
MGHLMRAIDPATVPEGKCPGCRTAELTYGRTICQACAVSEFIAARVVPIPTIAQDAARASTRVAEMDTELAEYEATHDQEAEVA